jgi:hypothetical protein
MKWEVDMNEKSVYEKVKGVFTQKDVGYKYEWQFNYDLLKELTNEEFADKVKEQFNEMHGDCAFHAEVKKVHHRISKNTIIYVSLGHFIYSHIWSFSASGHIDKRIFNQEYFEFIMKPHMNVISKEQKSYHETFIEVKK